MCFAATVLLQVLPFEPRQGRHAQPRRPAVRGRQLGAHQARHGMVLAGGGGRGGAGGSSGAAFGSQAGGAAWSTCAASDRRQGGCMRHCMPACGGCRYCSGSLYLAVHCKPGPQSRQVVQMVLHDGLNTSYRAEWCGCWIRSSTQCCKPARLRAHHAHVAWSGCRGQRAEGTHLPLPAARSLSGRTDAVIRV